MTIILVIIEAAMISMLISVVPSSGLGRGTVPHIDPMNLRLS